MKPIFFWEVSEQADNMNLMFKQSEEYLFILTSLFLY